MNENISTWAATGWVIALLGLVGIVLRSIGPWRKQISETEERLRNELAVALAEERACHAADQAARAVERTVLTGRVEKLEKLLTRERLRHNAERALDRHRLNNITQCFDALLLLVETTPERAPEIVKKVKEMRASQLLAEAEEKALIRAAEITADDTECDHDGN